MSKLLGRIAGYLSNRTLVGVDKVGNRYFTRTEEIDGIRPWVSPLPVVNLCLFFSLSGGFVKMAKEDRMHFSESWSTGSRRMTITGFGQ